MRHDWWRQSVGLALAFSVLAWSGSVEASEEPTPDPGAEVRRMVSEVRAAVRVGDFASAWEAYRGVFPLALFNESAHAALNEHCPPTDCPDIGELAWLLGKSRSDLGFLDEALGELSHPQLVEWWRAYFETVGYAYVGPDRRPERKGPNEAWLYSFSSEDDRSPLTRVRLAGTHDGIWALLDTGAFGSQVSENFAISKAIEFATLTGLQSTRRWDGSEQNFRDVMFKDIVLGESVEELVPGSLNFDPKDTIEYAVLGASLLLRYDALCFAWGDRVVYLGGLGPCSQAQRLAATGAELHINSIAPSTVIPLANGRTVRALIDTGSDVNLCKASLAKALAGTAVKFGRHPLMAAGCNPEPAHIMDDYMFDMVIGMETLSTFAAFGWELNPLRLYFVPREDED